MKYSIIIPFYNRYEKVERCILGLLDILIDDIEILLVDDGSNIEVHDKVSTLIDNDSRFKLLKTKHVGVSHARNIGIETAIGELIIFIDSDDYVKPDILGEILQSDMPDNQIQLFGFTKRWNNNEIIEEIRFATQTMPRDTFLRLVVNLEFDRHMINPIWNKIYPKSVIKRIGTFNENCGYGEDLEFNCRVFDVIDEVRVNDIGYYNYIIDINNSISTSFCPNILENEIICIDAMINTFCKKNMTEDMKYKFIRLLDKRRDCLEKHFSKYIKNKTERMKNIQEINNYFDREKYRLTIAST